MFDPDILTQKDRHLAQRICWSAQKFLPYPDVTIAPDGKPYLYRWHVIPRNEQANVYFHIQVGSDPDRGLHDHPWENMSVILAGGYQELVQVGPPYGLTVEHTRRPGDVIQRQATYAHRLLLPPGVPYSMTMFSTGPKTREWGFWVPSHQGRPNWVQWDSEVEQRNDGVYVNRRLVA